MDHNPAVWFEIYVQDMERAKQFYASVFQTSFRRLTPPEAHLEIWAFSSDMHSYGTSGALVKMKGMPSGGNSTLIYFHCEDCALEESRVVAAGGRIQRSKVSIGEFGCISLVYDTEGNLIGLHSMQ